MFSFPQVASAREIQRNYRKLFDRVKKTKKPLVILRNNKPDVAIVDFEDWEELEAIRSVIEGYKEARSGKAKVLSSLAALWQFSGD